MILIDGDLKYYQEGDVMKKTALLAIGAWMLGRSASAVMAAPVNQLSAHETAAGIGTKEAFVEHKVTDKATVGADYANRDACGDQKSLYLQYDVIRSNFRVIGGYRWSLPGRKNQPYAGLAVSSPKILGFDAYASYIAGKDFNETQVGVNKNILWNVDFNLNYHNFKPKHGSRENGIGAGVTLKF